MNWSGTEPPGAAGQRSIKTDCALDNVKPVQD